MSVMRPVQAKVGKKTKAGRVWLACAEATRDTGNGGSADLCISTKAEMLMGQSCSPGVITAAQSSLSDIFMDPFVVT